jgi:hypothetical protein
VCVRVSCVCVSCVCVLCVYKATFTVQPEVSESVEELKYVPMPPHACRRIKENLGACRRASERFKAMERGNIRCEAGCNRKEGGD